MRTFILATAAGALMLSGCSQQTQEKASETADAAAADAQANANSAGQTIDSAAQAAGEAINTAADKAGAAVSTAANKAGDSVRHTKIEIKHTDSDDKTAQD
jgi:PBP1b-binding outer membrane lipoprotein LpoB